MNEFRRKSIEIQKAEMNLNTDGEQALPGPAGPLLGGAE
jgi:hypothetical protein